MRSKVTQKIIDSTPDEIRESVREQANEMANTTENNLLIAEFMGYSVRYFGPVLYFSDEDGFIDFTGDARTFMPHLSWDDLMPVIEKISLIRFDYEYDYKELIGEPEDEEFVIVKRKEFDFHYPRTFGMIERDTKQFMVRFNPGSLFIEDKLIDAAYKAVVEFIKWHNQQKQ